MMYSCFNQSTGLYEYFQDDSTRPINGDLPIPKLPASTGRIGVPSIEAGRPLPGGAKKIGKGWHARGMVVQCGLKPLGAEEASLVLEGRPKEAWVWFKAGGWKWVLGTAAAIWVVRRI